MSRTRVRAVRDSHQGLLPLEVYSCHQTCCQDAGCFVGAVGPLGSSTSFYHPRLFSQVSGVGNVPRTRGRYLCAYVLLFPVELSTDLLQVVHCGAPS